MYETRVMHTAGAERISATYAGLPDDHVQELIDSAVELIYQRYPLGIDKTSMAMIEGVQRTGEAEYSVELHVTDQAASVLEGVVGQMVQGPSLGKEVLKGLAEQLGIGIQPAVGGGSHG